MEQSQEQFETIWRTALGELEVAISKPNFITWFRHTFIVGFENQLITIGVPNSFALEWLSNKYRAQILEVLRKLLPDDTIKDIAFRIAQSKEQVLIPTITVSKPHELPVEQAIIPITQAAQDGETTINPTSTFESFIVGTHNRLAHAAARAIASEPGKRHNPFFIYGGVGLGKTHLMHAIANEVKRKWPKMRILYAPCESFANEYISAIQTKKTEVFKEKYRNVDVLLIDDIQFLSGKEGTQEAFFHTFNALHQTNRQIILTSDRMPQAINNLEDRLSSRFVWGMVTDIKSPDLETRSAILQQKCSERGMQLDPESINLIAYTYQSNIRELEGALNQILTICELEGVEPSYKAIEQILRDKQPKRSTSSISIESIVSLISRQFHIETHDLLGQRRNKEFVYPRQILMYLLRHELNFSFPKIGRELSKDHTTIMHGVEKIEKELPKNNQLQSEISHLKDALYH